MAPGYALTRSDVAFRTALTVGTMLGGCGAVVAVWSLFAGFQIHGCAAGLLVGVLFLVAALSVGWVGLIALVAVAGVTFVWFKYNLGAALMLASNIAVVATIGVFGPTESGHAGEVATMFILLVPAALVIGGIIWTWAMRSPRLRDRVVILFVVAFALTPIAVLVVNGFAQDVALAATTPPTVATASCGSFPG